MVRTGGPIWSGALWVRSGALSSCVHLSTTNVEHLGSITSLEVIKSQSVRNKFTCSCSFLARRLVSGSWFVSLMLDGEFLTFEVSCTVGMSPSGMPHAHKAYQKKRYILKEGISHAPKACQKRRRRKYSPYQKDKGEKNHIKEFLHHRQKISTHLHILIKVYDLFLLWIRSLT